MDDPTILAKDPTIRALRRLRAKIEASRRHTARLEAERDELIRGDASKEPRRWGRSQELADAAGVTRGRVSQILAQADADLEGLR